MSNKTLLKISSVYKSFPIYSSVLQRVVDTKHVLKNVHLELEENVTLGVIGESGCGKTTLGKMICRIELPDKGKIFFCEPSDGSHGNEFHDITTFSRQEFATKVQLVFQNPYSSLNPKLKIKTLIKERMIQYFKLNKMDINNQKIQENINEMLEIVKLPSEILNMYPYQLSGGQKQRVAILLVICLKPKILILDEPLSALDVSLQAQMLNFFNDLKQQFGFSYIFITHDLNLAEYFCDKIVKIQDGMIIDQR